MAVETPTEAVQSQKDPEAQVAIPAKFPPEQPPTSKEPLVDKTQQSQEHPYD